MGGIPSGTVTFLFTDVEDSTRWWDLHPVEMRLALGRHDELIRDVVGRHEGYVFSTSGDSFAVAFDRVGAALGAAVEMQRMLRDEPWPEPVTMRIRMALHTGEASERDGDYFGTAVNRAARLLGVASGGDVVCSETTAQLLRPQLPAGLELASVGVHRLRGLVDPERVFAVVGDGLIAPAVIGRGITGNLPRSMGRLIGRAHEQAEIASLVATSPVVTLTGPGGVGKTSLALQVAHSLADTFSDGAWWLELAPIADDGDVLQAAAASLEIRDRGGQPLLATVCDALEQRRLLIVVDNCEHVTRAASELVAALGKRCAGVTVLATSRERLGVPGERAYPVHPLAAATVDDSAVELLLERIDRADLVEDPVEMAALLQIGQSLDGLPLALELAAGRCVSLQPSDVATRLGSRLRLLADSRRVEVRHRTVMATIEWSYELLTERDRLVFDRLAVCTAWDLETAETICADESLDSWDVDEAIAGLVDKSLVEREGRWYRMLETTRAFALERLRHRGELEFRQGVHMAFFSELTQAAMGGLRGPDEARWVDLLDVHWSNIRGAFRRALATGDAEAATVIVAHLSQEGQWRRQEAQAWSRDALAQFDGDPQPLAHVLLGAAAIAEWMRGDIQRGLELGLRAMQADPTPGRSIDLLPENGAVCGLGFSGRWSETKAILDTVLMVARETGDRWTEMMWQVILALYEYNVGDPDMAKAPAHAACAIAAEVAAPSAAAWTTFILAAVHGGSDDECLEWLDLASYCARAVRNVYVDALICNVRSGFLARRDPVRARGELVRVASDLRRSGWILHSWVCIASAAEVLVELGETESAARLLGAARASPWQHMMARPLDALSSAIAASLDASRLDPLLAEGARMDFETASEIAASPR